MFTGGTFEFGFDPWPCWDGSAMPTSARTSSARAVGVFARLADGFTVLGMRFTSFGVDGFVGAGCLPRVEQFAFVNVLIRLHVHSALKYWGPIVLKTVDPLFGGCVRSNKKENTLF